VKVVHGMADRDPSPAPDGPSLESLLPQIVALALAAGKAVTVEYDRFAAGDRRAGVTRKADHSPLTTADLASQRAIAAGLAALPPPHYPVLSEEGASAPYEERARWTRFWLVDPLDGTKEFLQRNGEFTVNIALVAGNEPVLGVVHAPALGVTYWAGRGLGAFVRDETAGTPQPIHAADYRAFPALQVVVSRSHAGALTRSFLSALGPHECTNAGSSLKLCRIAEGAAHLYPRFGPTMEWDTGAAHCVVREAGGTITDLAGRELRYNKRDLHNPYFIAAGGPPFPWQHFVSEDLRRAAAS
jgi:3'(2'), 5'-bisphosphate nucleotidase